MDVYLCLKDENRSLHKEKLHYLWTPFLKQVYIYNSHPYGNSLHGNQLYETLRHGNTTGINQFINGDLKTPNIHHNINIINPILYSRLLFVACLSD